MVRYSESIGGMIENTMKKLDGDNNYIKTDEILQKFKSDYKKEEFNEKRIKDQLIQHSINHKSRNNINNDQWKRRPLFKYKNKEGFKILSKEEKNLFKTAKNLDIPIIERDYYSIKDLRESVPEKELDSDPVEVKEKNKLDHEQFKRTRWYVLLGGFLLSLMGGMSYAWGSFVVPLSQNWGFTTTEANLPFTVMIIVFAISMIPAGWIQDKYGPRKVAAAGASVFLIGYSLAGLIRYFTHPAWLTLSYGIGVGIACGLTYAVIAPTARKWFSDRPGFAVSIAVMGFGLAAVVFAPLQKQMINAFGVDGTLFALGVFVTIVAFLGSRLIRNPPQNWSPPSTSSSPSKSQSQPSTPENVPPKKFVKTPVFYLLWLALAAVIGGGLMAIGLLTAYGEIELQLPPVMAALAVSFYSAANGLGRPFMGWIADRIGTVRVMMIIYTVQAAVFLGFPWIATTQLRLFLSSILLGMGYAATFALFPVVVAEVSGTKHLGTNYGLVFSAFGLGAITGLMGSWLLDLTESFTPAFLLSGTATILGLILLITIHKKYGVK